MARHLSIPRWTAPAMPVLALAAALTGCTDDSDDPGTDRPSSSPTVAAGDAESTYGSVLPDVDRALGGLGVRGVAGGPATYSSFDVPDGVCTYAAGGWTYPSAFGTDVDWDEVRDVVGGVVEPAGFELTAMLEVPGGYTGFDAVAPDGARVQVRAKSGSTVDLSAPVQGSCPQSPTTAPPG